MAVHYLAISLRHEWQPFKPLSFPIISRSEYSSLVSLEKWIPGRSALEEQKGIDLSFTFLDQMQLA